MEREIEFKNFRYDRAGNIISDMYVDGEFILTMSSKLSHIRNARDTKIGLYELFRRAMIVYIDAQNILDLQEVNNTAH